MGCPGRGDTITPQSAAEGIKIDRGTAGLGEGVVRISEVMQAHQRIRPLETEAGSGPKTGPSQSGPSDTID